MTIMYDLQYGINFLDEDVLNNLVFVWSKSGQGVRCKRVARSIGSVGIYVPGGTAVLPSTALMLSVVCVAL